VKSPLLDGDELIKTVHRLTERIRDRFPAAHLNEVAAQLQQVVERHAARSGTIRRPHWGRRIGSSLLLLAGLATFGLLLATVRIQHDGEWQIAEAMQTLEAGLSMLFFLGAGAAYVASLEQRSKRQRCLEALHELRAIAHIVDLHQLSKQPEIPPAAATPAPDATTSGTTSQAPATAARLVAYLEFCSDMLALVGKVAALYVQGFPDERAVAAVDDIEDLTSGLSRKIWQKIMVLNQARGGATT
jgi:hypothetical protein